MAGHCMYSGRGNFPWSARTLGTGAPVLRSFSIPSRRAALPTLEHTAGLQGPGVSRRIIRFVSHCHTARHPAENHYGRGSIGRRILRHRMIMIAVTARDDAVYVLKHPIGSDVHSNGGALFLWLAPIALGNAALAAHRISRRKSIWSNSLAFSAYGFLGSSLPALL